MRPRPMKLEYLFVVAVVLALSFMMMKVARRGPLTTVFDLVVVGALLAMVISLARRRR